MNALLKNAFRLLLLAAFLAPLAACQGEKAAVSNEKPAVAPPKDENIDKWREYVKDVVERNLDGVTGQTFVYLLPAESSADFEGSYDRQLDTVRSTVSRGVLPGNLLAFAMASPNSDKLPQLVEDAFAGAKADKLKDVKLIYIGKPADSDRVKAAVESTGVKYVFVSTEG